MSVRILTGDCIDVMRTLPDASFDAVVTDPPYGINTKSDGDGKLSPWADLCNAALWYSTWIAECRRLLKRRGCLWSFLNWRSMTTFQKAACDLRWPIESLLVWDKCWIGPGGVRGLRPSYELVALWAMPDFAVPDRGLADIQRFPWSGTKPTGHPAEKPTDAIDFLLTASGLGEGATILDPFCGSGTTLLVAERRKMHATGIELDAEWARRATARVRGDSPLFAEVRP